eukprot:GHVU01037250.1.p1 GENE.GHVU01037250.1~~GHVU01037250.1.p1  ORF type:complete len:119 (-),score=5.60 GHVU01037250.1:137-493(-)
MCYETEKVIASATNHIARQMPIDTPSLRQFAKPIHAAKCLRRGAVLWLTKAQTSCGQKNQDLPSHLNASFISTFCGFKYSEESTVIGKRTTYADPLHINNSTHSKVTTRGSNGTESHG